MSNNKKLTNTQIKFLKGIAHGLKPVIIIGNNGVTESLLEELENSLEHHEILKIKIASGERAERKEVMASLQQKTKAQLVQSIGKIFVLFRQNKDTNLPLPK